MWLVISCAFAVLIGYAAWQWRRLKHELDAKWTECSDGSGVETWPQLDLLLIYRRNLLQEKLARLRALAQDYKLAVFQASELRALRDGLALQLVDEGLTWREVAEAAGFENPYIAALLRKREGV